jgi:drug/metabolite transporter (DMT)-like permease
MELHRVSGRSGLGLAFALITAGLWAVLALALKIVLQELDAGTITWFRFTVAAVVLAAVLQQRGSLPPLGRLLPAGWVLLGVATVFLAANYVAFLIGLDYTTSANAQVLIQLSHLLLALGGIFVFGERFGGLQWVGLAVLTGGLGLFFSERWLALASDPRRYLEGSLWIVGAAVTWAIFGLAQKQLLRWLPAQGVMLCIYAGCALLLWPAASPAALLDVSGVGLATLVFCALNTVAAYGTFAEALVHWEASRVSAVLALTPLGTLGFAALGHHWFPEFVRAEPLTLTGLAGAALVVGGSLCVSLGARAAARHPAEPPRSQLDVENAA